MDYILYRETDGESTPATNLGINDLNKELNAENLNSSTSKDMANLDKGVQILREETDKQADGPIVDYLEKSGLSDSEKLEALIQNGYYEDFRNHLVHLNALIRSIPPEDHIIDGEKVLIKDGLVPISSEFKEKVVEMAFDSLKCLSLKDRGLLMYNILVSVHLFVDGNGRLARIYHHLLSGERLDDEQVQILIKHDKLGSKGIAETGRQAIAEYLNVNSDETGGIVNQLAFAQELDAIGAKSITADLPQLLPRSRSADGSIPKNDLGKRLMLICQEDTSPIFVPFNIMTMYMLSKEDPTFTVPPASMINGDYCYHNEKEHNLYFTQLQAQRFVDINNELKIRSFQTLIDIFKNPERYKFTNGSPIKEIFYSRGERGL